MHSLAATQGVQPPAEHLSSSCRTPALPPPLPQAPRRRTWQPALQTPSSRRLRVQQLLRGMQCRLQGPRSRERVLPARNREGSRLQRTPCRGLHRWQLPRACRRCSELAQAAAAHAMLRFWGTGLRLVVLPCCTGALSLFMILQASGIDEQCRTKVLTSDVKSAARPAAKSPGTVSPGTAGEGAIAAAALASYN